MIPSWLDTETQALIADIRDTVQQWDRQRVIAIILYGSVARHKERPLHDPQPSDVDLLIIFHTEDPAAPYAWGISATLGAAYRRHLSAPREVNIMFATRTLQEWDDLFIENVARDGILLYRTSPLPTPLMAIEEHAHIEQPIP